MVKKFLVKKICSEIFFGEILFLLHNRIEEVLDLLCKAMLDEGACRNSVCQEASLHRCSGCLLVSYFSLQCSHLCWQEHRQLCNKEQMARKIRKEERREKGNKKEQEEG